MFTFSHVSINMWSVVCDRWHVTWICSIETKMSSRSPYKNASLLSDISKVHVCVVSLVWAWKYDCSEWHSIYRQLEKNSLRHQINILPYIVWNLHRHQANQFSLSYLSRTNGSLNWDPSTRPFVCHELQPPNSEWFHLSVSMYRKLVLICKHYTFERFTLSIQWYEEALNYGIRVLLLPRSSFAISLCSRSPDLSAVIACPIRYVIRFADYIGHCGDFRRLSRKVVFPSVAGHLRWFRSTRIEPPMRMSPKFSGWDSVHSPLRPDLEHWPVCWYHLDEHGYSTVPPASRESDDLRQALRKTGIEFWWHLVLTKSQKTSAKNKSYSMSQ
jgi:hypothetical protein